MDWTGVLAHTADAESSRALLRALQAKYSCYQSNPYIETYDCEPALFTHNLLRVHYDLNEITDEATVLWSDELMNAKEREERARTAEKAGSQF
jgi:hypothetical protein